MLAKMADGWFVDCTVQRSSDEVSQNVEILWKSSCVSFIHLCSDLKIINFLNTTNLRGDWGFVYFWWAGEKKGDEWMVDVGDANDLSCATLLIEPSLNDRDKMAFPEEYGIFMTKAAAFSFP
jgi:hypothetical protein